jgi:hypothetical protein
VSSVQDKLDCKNHRGICLLNVTYKVYAKILHDRLRTIYGPKIENSVYRRRYTHEFDKELNSPNALNVTKTSKMRYAGHMIRIPEDLPQRAVFRPKKSIKTQIHVGGWGEQRYRQTWRNLLQQPLTKYWL